MENSEPLKPSLKGLGIRRKEIRLSQEVLVKADCLSADCCLPLVVQPAIEGLELIGWAKSNRDFIETKLRNHGAILFRNFNVKTISEFEQFIIAVSGELLAYSYRSTPRSQVSGKIYTSTEYPAYQSIPLHNEMSYSRDWPLKIWFFSIKRAEQGGETPIADSRRVFARIDPKIRERFIQKNVMYVRNYRKELDLSWQNVFQTTSRAEVEEYCRKVGIEFEWMNGDRLRTRQLCQAVAAHPKTGEMVWFNQAHLFHISSLNSEIRDTLISDFSEEDLPRNTYYGDGSAIENSVLDEIREVYQQEAVSFPWQEGDVLMLDNMLTAHGREPYVGSRTVVVGMAEPFSNKEYLV